MSFISYAQNFEDVILYRALKDIDCGFYIDIGAGDPTDLSVTRAFYERGWRGINIEPMLQWFRRLEQQRPEDVNLQLAVSRDTDTSRFFEIADTGLSTLIEDVARRHEEQGYAVQSYDVRTTTLDAVIDEHGCGQIHFLKIDVEGAEEEVLASIDFKRTRPWVVVVEAMEPLSQVPTHERWNSRLLDHSYDAVYFDGLNQFYLGSEHSERRHIFHAPPNVLDDFVRFREWSLGNRVEDLRAELFNEREEKERLQHARQNLESGLLAEREAKKEVESELAGGKEEIKRLKTELAAIYVSWSWRITWPLRTPLAFLARLHHMTKHVARSVVIKSVNFVLDKPRLTAPLSALLEYFPGLRTRLKTLLSAIGWDPDNANAFPIQANSRRWHESGEASEDAYDLSILSESARTIYWELKRTTDKESKQED